MNAPNFAASNLPLRTLNLCRMFVKPMPDHIEHVMRAVTHGLQPLRRAQRGRAPEVSSNGFLHFRYGMLEGGQRGRVWTSNRDNRRSGCARRLVLLTGSRLGDVGVGVDGASIPSAGVAPGPAFQHSMAVRARELMPTSGEPKTEGAYWQAGAVGLHRGPTGTADKVTTGLPRRITTGPLEEERCARARAWRVLCDGGVQIPPRMLGH